MRKMAFLLFSVTLYLIISKIKSLSTVILDDSGRPNRIVQINRLHAIYYFFLFIWANYKGITTQAEPYILSK